MVDFSKREDVINWINSIEPEQRRREVAIVIAARAALRALPLLTIALRTWGKPEQDDLLSDTVLPTLRATALPWVAGKCPTKVKELQPFAHAAALTVPKFNASYATRTGRFANFTVRFSADQNATTVAAADAVEAACAFDTDFSPDFPPNTYTPAFDAAVAVAIDAQAIEAGRVATELAAEPLWPSGAPDRERNGWLKLEAVLLDDNEDWRVWTDWYQARLAGAPANEDLEIARVLIADEIWRQGPRAVNAEIARLIAAHQGISANTVHDQSITAKLIIGDIVVADVVPAANRRSNASVAPKVLPETDFDCFVSYATEDEAMAREVVGVLEGAKYRTISQFKDFEVGGNFVELMNRGLSRSARVVALYSPYYWASAHCKAEWANAYNLDPSGTERRLVPFLIAPTALNPLAQQVIYKSLVGLNPAERRAAILDAFARKPPTEPPPIEAIPEQNRTGVRFSVDAMGRIDMTRAQPTADDLQRLHYEEMRYKVIDLVALGQMLGDLAPASSRMLDAIPERIEDASVDRLWHRANTLRQRFDAHVRAPDGKLGPHPSRLDSLVAAHLGDFIGSYNIFIIGDARGLELDRMQLGPQDREAARRLVLLAAPIALATNELDAPTTPAARETLNEQVDSAIGAPENIHGDQANEFAEKTTRNFVSELLRRAYEGIRKIGDGLKKEAGFANKEIRGGAYKAAGAAAFTATTVYYWPQLASFVARHALALKEFVTAAFHNPALVEIIDWIAKAASHLG